jgi:hypothetical protein
VQRLNIDRVIENLHRQRAALNELINWLITLQVPLKVRSNQGRKAGSMSAAERQIVGERMRKYWEMRKNDPSRTIGRG